MKKLLALIISLTLFIPSTSLAAIAFDAATGVESANGNASVTHTATTTTNRLAILDVFTTGADNLTTLTYGGTSVLANLVKKTQIGGGSTDWMYEFYMLNPPSGAQTVNAVSSNPSRTELLVTTYTGVSQTGFPDSSIVTTSAAQTSVTVNTTTTADNAWIHGMFINAAGSASTAGANTTIRFNSGNSFPPSVNISVSTDTNGPMTPAGVYGQTVTSASPVIYGGIAVSFAPFTAAPAVTNQMQVIWMMED